MQQTYYTLDVFTDRLFGGNPLAVFPDAQGIAEPAMQKIASELNLSETVFCFPPETPTGSRKVRIFTPRRELPFAGHPTVGTAFLLADLGLVPTAGGSAEIVLEERVGLVPVAVRGEGGQPTTATLSAARMPEFGPALPSALSLSGLLSLQEAEVQSAAARALSCGVPFVYVPVHSRDALSRCQIQNAVWSEHLAKFWATDVFAFYLDPTQPGVVHARMFAPSMGIAEDPATGSAATALAGWLHAMDPQPEGTRNWTVLQGEDMGRPSRMDLSADISAGAIHAIRVGGRSVRVARAELALTE